MASDSDTPQLSPKQTSETLDDTDIPPCKRLKTLGPVLSSPLSLSSKGKDKIDESTVESEPNSCGICLMEDGKAIRGWIDSCDHYFCFVCIMEWAKVESRCPMCKRRFGTIRRPPKDRLFLRERVVNVPVRDQVCHYLGNATMAPPDPYSDVQCSVCHNTTDESLLLLCDLCDSASHTFCVGLGATVPEGDWFCQDCTISRAEHSKSEIDGDNEDQTSFMNYRKLPPADAPISIFDIVREVDAAEVQRPTTVSLQPNQFSSHIVTERGVSVADSLAERDSRMYTTVVPNVTVLGARTLRRCRNVHGHIRALRENWNGFRSGSLNFSSGSVDSGSSSGKRDHIDALAHDKSGQSSVGSCRSQQLASRNELSTERSHNGKFYDVEKAWKMMDVAKSMEMSRDRAIIGHQASKRPSSKINAPRGKSNMNSNVIVSNSKPPGSKKVGGVDSEKDCHYHILEMVNNLPKSPILEKRKQSIVTGSRDLKFNEGFAATHAPYFAFQSARKAQSSSQIDICHGICGKQSKENVLGTLSDVNKQDGSAHLICTVKSVQMASNVTSATFDASSSFKMEAPQGEAGKEKVCGKGKSTRDDDAKSEIQSLVKLNLKLLSREKKLEVDVFKEVARLATHSILAACGLEPPKPGVRSFSSSVCSHANQGQKLRMSTLMPTSCRECFYVFVKDVVKTVMLEKASC